MSNDRNDRNDANGQAVSQSDPNFIKRTGEVGRSKNDDIISYMLSATASERREMFDMSTLPHGSAEWHRKTKVSTIYHRRAAFFMLIYVLERKPVYLRAFSNILQKATATLEAILKTEEYGSIDMVLDDCFTIRYSQYSALYDLDGALYYVFSGLNARNNGIVLVSRSFLSRIATYILGSRASLQEMEPTLSGVELKIVKKTFLHVILLHIAGSFSTIFPCKFTIHDHGLFNTKAPIHIFDYDNIKLVISRFALKGYGSGGKIDIAMPFDMVNPMFKNIRASIFVHDFSYMRETEDFRFINKKILDSQLSTICVLCNLKMAIKQIIELKRGDFIPLGIASQFIEQALEDDNNLQPIAGNTKAIKAHIMKGNKKIVTGILISRKGSDTIVFKIHKKMITAEHKIALGMYE